MEFKFQGGIDAIIGTIQNNPELVAKLLSNPDLVDQAANNPELLAALTRDGFTSQVYLFEIRLRPNFTKFDQDCPLKY